MNVDYGSNAQKNLHSSQDEIVMVGPPSRLCGVLHIENMTDEPVALHEVPLKRDILDGKGKKRSVPGGTFRMMLNLGARESKRQRVFCAMDPHTAPGIYESEITVGNSRKKTTLIVQNHLSVSLNPDRVYLVGIEPGKRHEVQIQMMNNGNIPVQVPNLRHSTTLDMDLFCRNLALSVRESGDNGTVALLDTFVKGLKRDMAGWLDLSVAESGTWMEPGEAKLLHLTMTLPEDIHLEREYRGDIRLYNQLLSYMIIDGPKPPKDNGKK